MSTQVVIQRISGRASTYGCSFARVFIDDVVVSGIVDLDQPISRAMVLARILQTRRGRAHIRMELGVPGAHELMKMLARLDVELLVELEGVEWSSMEEGASMRAHLLELGFAKTAKDSLVFVRQLL